MSEIYFSADVYKVPTRSAQKRLKEYEGKDPAKINDLLADVFGDPVPIKKEDVTNWLLEAYKAHLDTEQPIALESSSTPQFHLEGDAKKLFVHVKVDYWDAERFSPSANHDVVAISIRERHTVTRPGDWGNAKTSLEVKNQRPFLLTVPETASRLKEGIKGYFASFAQQRGRIISCANGNEKICIELNQE